MSLHRFEAMAQQSDQSLKPESNADAGSPVSSTKRVLEDLRGLIIQGKLAPGEKLKIESLKSLLDTGASPIREALSLLTSDQLVERIDQRGFRVAPASAEHFSEILTLRCQLDIIALKSSIDLGDAAWEESLLLSHSDLTKTPRDNPEHWESLHKAFHCMLLSACDSPILLRFCTQLYDLNIRYRYLAGKSGGYSKRNLEQEHEDIMQAALDRNTELAVSRLMSHYTLTGEFLAASFE